MFIRHQFSFVRQITFVTLVTFYIFVLKFFYSFKFKPMKTLKFSSLRDDNTQNVSWNGNGIKLATIWYDFDTIVFEHEIKAISIQEVTEISQAIQTNSVLISE